MSRPLKDVTAMAKASHALFVITRILRSNLDAPEVVHDGPALSTHDQYGLLQAAEILAEQIYSVLEDQAEAAQ